VFGKKRNSSYTYRAGGLKKSNVTIRGEKKIRGRKKRKDLQFQIRRKKRKENFSHFFNTQRKGGGVWEPQGFSL